MRVVVVDDHPVFRKGLVALLSADGIDVVGEAENGLEAIATVAETSPDVVLNRCLRHARAQGGSKRPSGSSPRIPAVG